MLDRESTFADPEIVEMLKTRFVPVAIDQALQRRQKDTEGEFYRKISGQGPRKNNNQTTQGFYIHQSLARGDVPESLQHRMARFHLVDNTRGEPPMWKSDEIRESEMNLSDGQLSGAVHLETARGDRGYQAQLKGVVEVVDGVVNRFDMVVLGQFWGEGRYTRGAPKGRFPLAISFTLADGSDVADRIPPQGSRGWLRGYLK